jgi:4a-hydroxytetrahydrobiopterin dehydratase
MSDDLNQKRCLPCEGGVLPLDKAAVNKHLAALPQGWIIDMDSRRLSKPFDFKNYYHTMAFVNAIAWMAHHEDHHPDLEVRYNQCIVHYQTHAIKGLSLNDFICATKVETIFACQ